MKPCIATVSLSGNLEQKLIAAALAGFQMIEVVEQDLMASGLSPKDLCRRLSELGISVAALQPSRDVEGLPEPARSASFERVARQLDLAASLEANMLLICSSVSTYAMADPGRIAEDLAAIADMAKARGLRIGYEALAWGKHIANHADAWEVVRRADHPALGLVLDSFHTLGMDMPTDDIPTIPADRIFLVQIADAPRLQMDILRLSRHHRRLPFLGDHDLPRFIAAVEASGYAGPLSIEVFSDEFRAANPVSAARDAMLSLSALGTRMIPVAPTAGGPIQHPGGLAHSSADEALKTLPTAELGTFGVSLSLGPADRKITVTLTDARIGPGSGLIGTLPEGTVTGVDYIVLRALSDTARHAKLRLSAALGLGWQDLADMADPDGPIRLAQLRSKTARLLMAIPSAERDDAHCQSPAIPNVDLLCLEVADIALASAALISAGHTLLPVPPAHLAIAGAQLGLPERELAQLAAAQVFIDKDASGRYFQVFLANPINGTMISFAERRGGYTGFGLGNAVIWLTHRRRQQP